MKKIISSLLIVASMLTIVLSLFATPGHVNGAGTSGLSQEQMEETIGGKECTALECWAMAVVGILMSNPASAIIIATAMLICGCF